MKLGLVTKIVGAILIVFAASIALVAVLIYLKFDRVYSDAYALRYDSVARESQAVIERSLGAGLSLEANVAGRVAIERIAERHTGGVVLALFSTSGAPIATTAAAPEFDISALARAVTSTPDALIRHPLGTHLVTAAAIRNQGFPVGFVAVFYPAEPAERALDGLRDRMLGAALALGLIFAPVLFIVVFWIVYPQERRFARDAAKMRRMANGDEADPTGMGVLARAAEVRKALDQAGGTS